MKKKISYVATFLLVLILTGCAGSENEIIKDTDQEAVILTYGYIDSYNFMDLDNSIKERIISFNKSQNDYYIEIVKYGTDNYADGLKALHADISSGKGPDIIEIPNETLLQQYGAKGIIDDLYPYMNEGEWPRREDFVENILYSFETEDKLYGLTPFFRILSVIGNPDYIQSEQVTFTQLKEMYEENKDNDDITVCNALSKNFLLNHCITSSIDSFVDIENKSCDFMNLAFQELLEFSAQFEMFSDLSTIENMVRVQEGTMILYYSGIIGGFRDYTNYRELSGKSGLMIGFPSIDGCSPEITTNFPFLCINNKSKHKDAAWQFLCTFLEDSYLIDDNKLNIMGFPVTQTGFEGVARKQIDRTKNVLEEGSVTDVTGATLTFPTLPVTQEDVDYIKEIISSAKRPSAYYREIETIITEEIESYWNGSKTVQDVMEIIQNRTQLYLNER